MATETDALPAIEVEIDDYVSLGLDYANHLQRLRGEPEWAETHADAASVQVWGTAAASEAFESIDPDDPSQSVTFPEGTMFVKEHFDATGAMFGVNIMVKGPAGYDPEGGDWVWIRVRGDEVTDAGRVGFCRECHAAAINSDFVVGFGKSQ